MHAKARELFERFLKDEEGHVDWLEAQVHQIREIGYERYLSQQMRKRPDFSYLAGSAPLRSQGE